MGTIRARINAGVCGNTTEVLADSPDEQHVRFQVTSTCENIQRLAGHLCEVDAFTELGAGYDGHVHQAARAAMKPGCSGCVVPVGIHKAMQAAAGLALPRPVDIVLEREM